MNIRDFGRKSFVHTTGLKERIQKAESKEKRMIKYKDSQGNIIEVEGKLFITLDRNGKDVFAGDETNKGIAIGAFKNWVWTYKKDPSTFHWHINIKADIKIIEEKDV